MLESELDAALGGILERGFDDSFPSFCARTLSSHEYPNGNVSAARMHAFWLRVFIEDRLYGKDAKDGFGFYGELFETALEIGGQVVDWALGREETTGNEFCREFVKRWCERYARE